VRRVTTVYVPPDLLERLKQLKARFGARKYSDVIAMALDSIEKLEKLRVAAFLCVERAAARATAVAWARIFQGSSIPPDMGFYFLKADGSDLIVDREKCLDFFKGLGLTYQPPQPQPQSQGEQK
jgi:hypothetical protein